MLLWLPSLIFLVKFAVSADFRTRTFHPVSSDNLENEVKLKYLVTPSGYIEFEAVADIEGFVVIGFAHAAAHGNAIEYDTFLGGVKNGVAYDGSYNMVGTSMTRNPEVRFQVTEGSEDNGVTTMKFRRNITTCYQESFDWRDVGDAVLVKVIVSLADLDEVDPTTPVNVDLRQWTSATVESYATLFSLSQTAEDHLVDMELDYRSFDIELDTVYFPDHYSTCVTFSTDEDMDYIKGFKPKFEDTQTDVFSDDIHLIMVFQCNNEALYSRGGPSNGDQSDDFCRTGMSVANTYAFCQDVLFVWSKGSEGEMLPGNSAIKTNAPDSGGQRHFMMVVAFHDLGQISQWDLNGSGVTIYYDTGSNFVPASKLMVGHHISSKMILLPVDNWLVEGICPADCTGLPDLTEEDQINILAVSLHYGPSATAASLKVSTEDLDYLSLVTDAPAIPDFQPSNRILLEEPRLDLGAADVVVRCAFDGAEGTGGFELTIGEFCFGVLTYSPPMLLSTCTSVPTEFTLELALHMDLEDIRDAQNRKKRDLMKKKRWLKKDNLLMKRKVLQQVSQRRNMKGLGVNGKHIKPHLSRGSPRLRSRLWTNYRSSSLHRRAKRQSSDVLDYFLDREVISNEYSYVDEIFYALLDATADEMNIVNTDILNGEHMPICIWKNEEQMKAEDLDPITILQLEEAEVAVRHDPEDCVEDDDKNGRSNTAEHNRAATERHGSMRDFFLLVVSTFLPHLMFV